MTAEHHGGEPGSPSHLPHANRARSPPHWGRGWTAGGFGGVKARAALLPPILLRGIKAGGVGGERAIQQLV
jgi:hypothetical protein